MWAAILFSVHFLGFIIISYFGLKSLSDTNTLSDLGNKNDNFPLTSKSIIMLVVTAILGFFLSLIYMLCMRKFPKPLIIITLWLSVATFFVVAIAYGFFKQYVLVCLNHITYYRNWRSILLRSIWQLLVLITTYKFQLF